MRLIRLFRDGSRSCHFQRFVTSPGGDRPLIRFDRLGDTMLNCCPTSDSQAYLRIPGWGVADGLILNLTSLTLQHRDFDGTLPPYPDRRTASIPGSLTTPVAYRSPITPPTLSPSFPLPPQEGMGRLSLSPPPAVPPWLEQPHRRPQTLEPPKRCSSPQSQLITFLKCADITVPVWVETIIQVPGFSVQPWFWMVRT
jgi:hypothetical protein